VSHYQPPSKSLVGRWTASYAGSTLTDAALDAILDIVLEAAPKAALNVRRLRKSYKDVVAVDHVNLEVQPGECFGLLGPNGAGKTTTIEICEGLTSADSGEVKVLGMGWDSHAAELRQRLGIQLQETQLSEKLTVFETVRLFRSFFRQGPDTSDVIALANSKKSGSRAWVVFQAGKSSGLRSRARWWEIRIFCSSTNPPPGWIPKPGANSGG
jgi:ABC-type multidrug transport system fused ATPase/permease subunit